VVRPGRVRRRTRPALSWSCAALRGHRPRPTRTDMGSVRPARRFYARRALASRDLPSRIAPDGGPPCAFALLQRSIATPPHRPAGPKADRRTMLPPLGFRAVRHVPGRWTRVPRGLPAPLRAASGVWVPPSRRPPPSLPTPCGAGASVGFPLQGVLLASIGPPLGGPCPRGVARVGSPRPQGGVRTRSTPGPRSRREFVRTTGSRRTRRVDAFLGFTLQSVHPSRPGSPL